MPTRSADSSNKLCKWNISSSRKVIMFNTLIINFISSKWNKSEWVRFIWIICFLPHVAIMIVIRVDISQREIKEGRKMWDTSHTFGWKNYFYTYFRQSFEQDCHSCWFVAFEWVSMQALYLRYKISHTFAFHRKNDKLVSFLISLFLIHFLTCWRDI